MLSTERFSALLGLVALVLIAYGWERGTRENSAKPLGDWASDTVIATLLGARLGFVLTHAEIYWQEPLSALYIWQGGFSPLAGIAVGAAYTLWTFRHRTALLRPAALSALLALGVWTGVNLGVSYASPQVRGRVTRLPEIELQTTEEPLRLSELSGKPVVLNLWATWCGPCQRELPLLAEVAAEREEVQFVFASLRERPGTVTAYLARREIRLPGLAFDERGEVARAFRTLGTPTTLFFNAEGTLVERHVGELSRAALSDYLKRISP